MQLHHVVDLLLMHNGVGPAKKLAHAEQERGRFCRSKIITTFVIVFMPDRGYIFAPFGADKYKHHVGANQRIGSARPTDIYSSPSKKQNTHGDALTMRNKVHGN
ncbi:hypothetical protein ACFS07_13870 [Undibacterium arcticum]